MLKRALVVSLTVVVLLTFSVTALASPSGQGAAGVNDEGQLVFDNETASEATNNPMDVPGIK